jgi:hypothetical protein
MNLRHPEKLQEALRIAAKSDIEALEAPPRAISSVEEGAGGLEYGRKELRRSPCQPLLG